MKSDYDRCRFFFMAVRLNGKETWPNVGKAFRLICTLWTGVDSMYLKTLSEWGTFSRKIQTTLI